MGSVGRLVQHSRLTSENVLSFPFLREPVPFPLLEPERARAAATAGLTALAPLTVRRRIPGLALAWWAGGCTTGDTHVTTMCMLINSTHTVCPIRGSSHGSTTHHNASPQGAMSGHKPVARRTFAVAAARRWRRVGREWVVGCTDMQHTFQMGFALNNRRGCNPSDLALDTPLTPSLTLPCECHLQRNPLRTRIHATGQVM